VIRLKVPENEDVTFEDVVRGKITINSKEIDDQVLVKSDGFPTYHLAVVVDDHLMEITHVIRGEEWLPSTPKHILLYKAFGWMIPTHAHLSLLVNIERKKLSKRNGDVSVESYIEKGYLPEAFVNFLAFLGWNPGDDRELFSHDELIEAFTLERVQNAPAVFNVEKLNWYNKEYMKKITPEALVDLAYPFFVKAELCTGVEEKRDEEKALLLRILPLAKERAATLADLPQMVKFLFADTITYDPALLVWKKSTKEETLGKLVALYKVCSAIDVQFWDKASLEPSLMLWIKDNGFGNGDVLWPMRVALSGEQHSPGPFDLADFLGKEKSIERLKQAIIALGGGV
jgi:glutamyl-tRNA synthetase